MMRFKDKTKLLYYKIFMPQRRIIQPQGYEKFNAVLVSYKVPFIQRSFILCSEWQLEHPELMAFFLAEVKRLSLEYTGKPNHYICFFSSQGQRKRANVHIHVHLIENRFQKMWIYFILSVKNMLFAIWQLILRK